MVQHQNQKKKDNTDSTQKTTEISNDIEYSEWITLFNGKTFEGWHLYNSADKIDSWSIIDSAMVLTPDEKNIGSGTGKDIVTDNSYTNFELSIEWKISEGGNSGIFWGVFEDKKFPTPFITGPEIQVLDNERHKDAFIKPNFHQAGALYDIVEPTSNVCNPAGEWNSYYIKIDHRNNKGKVKLNNILINEFPLTGKTWDSLLKHSKFSRSEDYEYLGDERWFGFSKSKLGHICLQDHPGKAFFKNIFIKELN